MQGAFSANTSTGNNSFGNAEAYTDLSVGSAGWSGLGYESPAGLDYSMLDDSYYLHFAMKNDDVAAPSSRWATARSPTATIRIPR